MWIRLQRILLPIVALSIAAPSFRAAHAAEAEGACEPGEIRQFANLYCIDCHSEIAPEAGFAIETLELDFDDPRHFDAWRKIHDRLAQGEMPPEYAEQPPAEERQALLERLAEELRTADLERQRDTGRVPLRRLNRVEYEYTLRDLLALPHLDVKDMLPPDDSAHGFDNVASAQEFSYVQMGRYLEAAEAALDRAMRLRDRPERTIQKIVFQDQGRFSRQGGERGETRHVDEWVVFLRQPNSAQAPWRFNNRQPFPSGDYHFRVRCRGVAYDYGELLPQDRNHVASIYTREKRLLATFDIPAEPEVIEFTAWLHTGDQLEFFCATLDDRNSPGAGPVKPYKGPGIAVEYVEIEGPLDERWPQESYQRLFGNLPVEEWTEESGLREPALLTELKPRDPKRPDRTRGGYKGPPLMVVSEDPLQDAERLLRRFLRQAYRRPVEEAEFERCFGFARRAIEESWCFQDAMREAYKAALCSPDFLFLQERNDDCEPPRLDSYSLAARLSYFLWRSMPDETLLALAESHALQEPQVLREQLERMLRDPRAERFIEDFTRQWLDLDEIHATAPDRYLYPEYFCDNFLVESAVRETQAHFAAMLDEDLGASTVIASDFAMINERLAELYDLEGVKGCEIRRVSLPAESVRSGFLTQASVMKVTANGLTTSPVLRGAWVLDRILGQPMPPPPPNAGAIEPDTRGTTTVREQLVAHRRNESCAVCHVKIDPPGFALESFDVMGKARDRYRSFEEGDPVERQVADRGVRYKLGPAVDSSGETPDGKTFQDIREFRRLLLEGERQLARNLGERLLTFATGAGITFADRKTVEEILDRTQDGGYGLRSMAHEVVQSDPFRRK